MNKLFTQVQQRGEKKNKFDLTHDVKMSGKMGELLPVLAMDCVPDSNITIGCDSLIRFAPLIAPVMHRMDATIHYFFVPYRILWAGWEDFISHKPAAGAAPFVTMKASLTDAQERFLDYMAIPPWSSAWSGGEEQPISALPLAAYQMIWNEFYRDQNNIAEIDPTLASGANDSKIGVLAAMRKRAWEHDYFTSALPTAQQGSSVDIPLGVVEVDPNWSGATSAPRFEPDNAANVSGALDQAGTSPDPTITVGGIGVNTFNPDGSLIVGETTITDLRRAFKLQEWLERIMRGGQRYAEVLANFFGLGKQDARLDRPEYIIGIKSPVIVSEVLNTTGSFDPANPTDPSSPPQGSMAGHGVSVATGNYGNYHVKEHGVIIGVMSITPKTAYMQGIPKQYLKTDPFDYFWPQFQHIGEQGILNKEIFAYDSDGEDIFGYIPRYAEYKFMPSRVAGDFRTSLDYWTLSRIFAAQPLLNQDFIEVDPEDVERIFAVQAGNDNLWMHILNKISVYGPMAVYGNPQM